MERPKSSTIHCSQILSKALNGLKSLKRKNTVEHTASKLPKIEHIPLNKDSFWMNSLEKKQKHYPLVAEEYKLEDEIGRGGSAVVYRAQCLPLSETVAIKCLDLDKSNIELTKMEHEAQTLRLISHPNVLTAHCSFVVKTHLWEILPFMAGGSVHTILKANFPTGMDEPLIATVLKETLKALRYLHDEGHIHRDVKASNILVDADGSVKLADFGVAAFVFESGDREKMKRQSFTGTVFYMAPEVLFADGCEHGYDFKADIWSFGMTAIELAHGRPLFCERSPEDYLRIFSDPHLSKSFKEMISMCLAVDPHERPTAEKLLKHYFFRSYAKTPKYIANHLLGRLRPLSERMGKVEEKEHGGLRTRAPDVLLSPASCHHLEDEEKEKD